MPTHLQQAKIPKTCVFRHIQTKNPPIFSGKTEGISSRHTPQKWQNIKEKAEKQRNTKKKTENKKFTERKMKNLQQKSRKFGENNIIAVDRGRKCAYNYVRTNRHNIYMSIIVCNER